MLMEVKSNQKKPFKLIIFAIFAVVFSTTAKDPIDPVRQVVVQYSERMELKQILSGRKST